MSTKPPSEYWASTTAYYDAHADEFCEGTVAVDMSELYTPFLREIPACGRILDAGCGSGRDSLAFLKKGYEVVSIDASAQMVNSTTKLTGQNAVLMRFDEIAYENEFDGIWACASLLHIARQELNAVLVPLATALKPGGVLYMSFKLGESERIEQGRFFNDMTEAIMVSHLADVPGLEPSKLWITEDVRNERRWRQKWLNALALRRNSR